AYGGPGAGHGGFGGRSGQVAADQGGFYYDSVLNPVMHGSGGAPGDTTAEYGGDGGGLVLLQVDGTFTLNGMINADGGAGMGATDVSGGGSGGSVNILASVMAGSGLVTARGGDTTAGSYGGGGAGGRVAVVSTFGDTANLSFSVVGGNGVTTLGYSGGDGTVFYKRPTDAYGVIMVPGLTYTDREPTVISQPASIQIDTMTLASVNFISTQTAITVTSSLTITGIDQSYEQVLMKNPVYVEGGAGLTVSYNTFSVISTVSVGSTARFLSNTGITVGSVTVAGALTVNSNDTCVFDNLKTGSTLGFASNTGVTAGAVTAAGEASFATNSNSLVAALDPAAGLSFTGNTELTLTSATFRVNPTFSGTNTLNISTLTTTTHLTVPAGNTLEQHAAGLWSVGGDLIVAGTLLQDSLGTWEVDTAMTVQNGGVVTHNINLNTITKRLDITVGGALDILSGGAIHADAKGYSTGGPGAGGNDTNNGAGGGGHGGDGGRGGNVNNGGGAHDSYDTPLDMGGKGGDAYNFATAPGGPGGGYVKISVSGPTSIAGRLSADGGTGGNGTGSTTYGAAGGG
ncbi:MAG TPA: hypothetical protein PK523_11830, partial [Elusimicrobiales bacterium]|nr:hypothetical protein [Elusimicrobiales bacterium]